MNFSTLSGIDKLAVYGAVASIVGPILSSFGFGFGAGGFTLILAIAMLAVIFLPQLSPQTTLPGSKGSFMVVIGGIAAISAALALIGSLGWLGLFGANPVWVIGWLIGIAGGLLMGWAGWQAFQAEGGQLKFGTPAAPGSTPPPSAAPMAPPPPSAAPPTPDDSDTDQGNQGPPGTGQSGGY